MTELWKWENKTSTSILSSVHVLALICSIFIFLSSWVLQGEEAGILVNLMRVCLLIFNCSIAAISIYKPKIFSLPPFTNELLIGINAAGLLLQILNGRFEPELAYFTLFAVYFIGQFSNNKQFNEYYPILILASWFLLLLIQQPSNPNSSFILLFVALITCIVLYIINFSRENISDRLEIKEKAFNETDELFKNMFDDSPVGTALIDEELMFSQVNQSLINLVGYNADRLSKMSLTDLVTDETALVDQEILRNLFLGRIEKFKDKRQFINRDGSLSWVNMSLTAMDEDNSSEVSKIMLIAENITDEVSKYEKLKSLSERVDKADKQLKIYHKAHNYHLINPVRDIHQYLDWIKKQYLTPDDQPLFDSMGYLIEKVEHVEDMISDLGEFSKIDYRSEIANNVDVENIIEFLLKKLHLLITSKNAIIHYEQLPYILTNEQVLTDIFEELISNAIIHCKDKVPIVKISAKEHPDEWILSIADNGQGIDDVLKETIFDNFVRGNEASNGTGMGLAIVKKLVENIGGNIWLNSGINLGTTFYFSVPKQKIIHSIPN